MKPKKVSSGTSSIPAAKATPAPSAKTPIRSFLSGRQITERYGFSRRTLYRWAHLGLIDQFKINSWMTRYDEAQIIALIEGSRISGGVK